MAKEKSAEKKQKKDKHSCKDGVSKSSKKDKTKVADGAAETILSSLDGSGDQLGNGLDSVASVTVPVLPKSALVPFANPLADDKTGKKVLKGVKKAAKAKSLKRGVKEVVKALRKSSVPSTSQSSAAPHSVVVLAADISPMDVISHIPVLCEDHGVPYVYVTSRAELGAAGLTKRPTSVVLVGKEAVLKKIRKEEGEEEKSEEQLREEWNESYGDLVKVVKKASRDVRI